MERIRNFLKKGIVSEFTLIAGAIVGALAILGFLVVPGLVNPVADMRIEPSHGMVTEGEEFTVEIVVESATPVNVFSGELTFDPSVLKVASIDYNTSIADLWAKRPWFSNGEGTLNFIGGTTKTGGFLGTGSLITITFKTLGTGEGVLALRDAAILEHDGLGTFAELKEPIDALFTVGPEKDSVVAKPNTASTYAVVEESPTTDLNSDGKQSIADVSIFMLHITGNDPRFDFNLDGAVNTKDLSILLDAG